MLRGSRHAVQAAERVLDQLLSAAARSRTLTRAQVLELITESAHNAASAPTTFAPADIAPKNATGPLDVYAAGRRITPRSPNQQYYLESVRSNDMVFAIGPAGTGKTYLAVAAAIDQLKAGRVKKVVLCRPAVEAGEKLGFLPGDFQEKVNPYLRPLLDALHDMMDYETVRRFMATDVIEIAPLAFMRGRTLNDAAIILDEAQNTTVTQMQMFLTRMGQRSKVIVTGDVTQVDLPPGTQSGLVDAARRLRRVNGVAFCALERKDVVRHDLVQRVIEAYGGDRKETDTGIPDFTSDSQQQNAENTEKNSS